MQDMGLGIPWFGCPLFESAEDVSIIHSVHNYMFVHHGSSFLSSNGRYQLSSVPHGIIASHGRVFNRSTSIKLRNQGNSEHIKICSNGAIDQHENAGAESKLATIVKAWSQFFDDCIAAASTEGGRQNTLSVRHLGYIPWLDMQAIIQKFSCSANDPHMALIVEIANRMNQKLPHIVRKARKILLRERKMLSAGRIAEMDTNCLQWFVRQPGKTAIEKASVHNQCLQGISRRETFDTLENRVLRDFLMRSRNAARQYIRAEYNEQTSMSPRIKQVTLLKGLCRDLLLNDVFTHVAPLKSKVAPNYVLQSDLRYREVWDLYCRLLRQEEQEDRAWDWQSRTWADIVRILVGVALLGLSKSTNSAAITVSTTYTSTVHILREQDSGRRATPGTDPGPFFITTQGSSTPEWVLSMVHCDLADLHEATEHLSVTGGHCYLVLEHIGSKDTRVVILWSIHTASSKLSFSWSDVSRSASNALMFYKLDHQRYTTGTPALSALVLANSLTAQQTHVVEDHGNAPVLVLPAEPGRWANDLPNIRSLLLHFLQRAIA